MIRKISAIPLSRKPVLLAAAAVSSILALGILFQLGGTQEPRLGLGVQPAAAEVSDTDRLRPPESHPDPVDPFGRPERHLILLPGGGFMTYDAGFRGRMVPAAIAAGFIPHYLEYRLDDLPGAIDDVRELADRLSREHGRENVFVFGSSAGGSLATFLAGEARVAAAVTSSGLYDFRDWPWVSLYREPDFFDRIRLGPNARLHLSPIRRPLRCPVLAIHGTRDPIVSFFQAMDYAAVHRRASLIRTVGGHGIYRTRPATVSRGMRWLHTTANAQKRAEHRLQRMERERIRNQIRGGRAEAVRRLSRKMRAFEAARASRLCAAPRPPGVARFADRT